MSDNRHVSERSRSIVRRQSQAVEASGSRPVVQRSGTAAGGASVVNGSSELASEMSLTSALSIDLLPLSARAAGAVATGAHEAVYSSSSSSSPSLNQDSRGVVRVLKSPEGYGADIRAIFAAKDMRVMKGTVVKEVEAAQSYLHQAYGEAKRIVASAADDVQQAKAEAREQGRVEAFAEVVDELKRARNDYDKLMSGAEADMIELAFQIARQIIGHSIEVNPAVLRDIVAKSLVHVRGKRQVVVIVHPDDLDRVDELRHELSQEVEGAALYFGADPKVGRGGCVIETESGRLDARLDVQLNVLKEKLFKGGK